MKKEEIGTLAGIVWRALNEKGPLSFEDLQRETRLDTESVCTAIGWLARENKIEFDEQNGITSFLCLSGKVLLVYIPPKALLAAPLNAANG